MFTGILPAYVDRFARVWPRLSTTDPDLPLSNCEYYKRFLGKKQQVPDKKFSCMLRLQEILAGSRGCAATGRPIML